MKEIMNIQYINTQHGFITSGISTKYKQVAISKISCQKESTEKSPEFALFAGSVPYFAIKHLNLFSDKLFYDTPTNDSLLLKDLIKKLSDKFEDDIQIIASHVGNEPCGVAVSEDNQSGAIVESDGQYCDELIDYLNLLAKEQVNNYYCALSPSEMDNAHIESEKRNIINFSIDKSPEAINSKLEKWKNNSCLLTANNSKLSLMKYELEQKIGPFNIKSVRTINL